MGVRGRKERGGAALYTSQARPSGQETDRHQRVERLGFAASVRKRQSGGCSGEAEPGKEEGGASVACTALTRCRECLALSKPLMRLAQRVFIDCFILPSFTPVTRIWASMMAWHRSWLSSREFLVWLSLLIDLLQQNVVVPHRTLKALQKSLCFELLVRTTLFVTHPLAASSPGMLIR